MKITKKQLRRLILSEIQVLKAPPLIEEDYTKMSDQEFITTLKADLGAKASDKLRKIMSDKGLQGSKDLNDRLYQLEKWISNFNNVFDIPGDSYAAVDFENLKTRIDGK